MIFQLKISLLSDSQALTLLNCYVIIHKLCNDNKVIQHLLSVSSCNIM